jgi:hypothetical protein
MTREKRYTERLAIYLKPETIKRLEDFAEERGYGSLSRAGAWLIEQALKREKEG